MWQERRAYMHEPVDGRTLAEDPAHADVFTLVSDLRGALAADVTGRGAPSCAPDVLRSLQDATLGRRTPSDRILCNPLQHSHVPTLTKLCEGRAGIPRHRLVVDTTVNAQGNLDVRFSTRHLGDDGRWTHAPEWRELDLGPSGPGRRPDDEVMFVRGVSRLFGPDADSVRNEHGRADEDERRWRSLLSRCVQAAYETVARRLADRFDVALARYPVLVASGDDLGPVAGLCLVDWLEVHRGQVAEMPGALRRLFGIHPDDLWFARTKEEDAWGRGLRLSRIFKTDEGPASVFTARVAETWASHLETAERYGVWVPGRRHVARPGTPASRPDPVPFAAVPRTHVDTPSRLAARIRRVPGRTHVPGRPRPCIIRPEIAQEFGVTSGEDLLALCNRMLLASGQRTVACGDLPTTKDNLARMVRRMRTMMAAAS